MKRLFLSVLILLGFTIAKAQKLHLTLFGGISNYQGDLQSKRFTFQQANAAFGVGVLYEITQKLYVRGNVTQGKVKGDDKLNGKYLTRNLSFSSPITDIHLGLEYDILNSYDRSLVPYIFAGISAFHFNPSALDSTGVKVFLQPLGTEGQGFFMGRKKYELNSFALPFGAGLKFSLSENVKVRFEIGLRKTFTDYLDDLSTTYADETQLLLNNGQRAVDLAFRGDENKGGLTYPPGNTIRGNPNSKDWYYFTGLGISFRLSPKFETGSGGSLHKSKTGCPVNIY
jgi:opacity protein-like surface antigen